VSIKLYKKLGEILCVCRYLIVPKSATPCFLKTRSSPRRGELVLVLPSLIENTREGLHIPRLPSNINILFGYNSLQTALGSKTNLKNKAFCPSPPFQLVIQGSKILGPSSRLRSEIPSSERGSLSIRSEKGSLKSWKEGNQCKLSDNYKVSCRKLHGKHSMQYR
jgi:hypothetical protein